MKLHHFWTPWKKSTISPLVKILPTRMIFRELNSVTLTELPSKLIRQTLVSTCSLRVESLPILFIMAAGILQI